MLPVHVCRWPLCCFVRNVRRVLALASKLRRVARDRLPVPARRHGMGCSSSEVQGRAGTAASAAVAACCSAAPPVTTRGWRPRGRTLRVQLISETDWVCCSESCSTEQRCRRRRREVMVGCCLRVPLRRRRAEREDLLLDTRVSCVRCVAPHGCHKARRAFWGMHPHIGRGPKKIFMKRPPFSKLPSQQTPAA